jgi:hypothetical protein
LALWWAVALAGPLQTLGPATPIGTSVSWMLSRGSSLAVWQGLCWAVCWVDSFGGELDVPQACRKRNSTDTDKA